MNLSEVCARYLKAAGIGTVFGYPGDPSVGFLEACRTEGIGFVLARREGTAGLMAEAAGMLTGRPGVCLSTLGPGSTNLVNAVANAWLDRAPMLALSGQIDSARAPVFTHQVVDQRALFAPVSKWAAEVAPATVGQVLRKAHRLAVAPRPGPVHLSMHADHVTAEAADDAILLPPLEAVAGQVLIHSGTLPEARLRGARRPLILFGIAAMQAGAGPGIAALAERVGAAIVASPMAKGTVDEGHPRFAGTLDMACQARMWDFVRSADLVICAGFDAVELIKPWSVAAPVIHVDAVPNTDQIYAAETEMVGPIGPMLAALGDAVPEAAGIAEREIAAHRAALASDFEAGRVAGRMNPSDVIRVAREVLPDGIATADVGSHKLLVGQGWRPSGPRRLLMSNGLSSMGFSLPAAIAAKHLMPHETVTCFVGDGGLAMVQSELRLAASLGLGLRVVVFVDGSLNRIALKQMARQVPSTGTVIEETAIGPLAASMGCEGVVCEDEGALARALEAEPGDVPRVIGARIDPAQYAAQF